jgi:hypothetical protein
VALFGQERVLFVALTGLIAMMGVRRLGADRLAAAYLGRQFDRYRNRCWCLRSDFQHHLDFFDRNGDGVMTLLDTHARLKQLDVSFSIMGLRPYFFTALILNLAIGRRTWQLPRPLYTLTVNTDAAHLIRDNPHSEIWNEAGRFTESKLDTVLTQWDGDLDQIVEESELEEMRGSIERSARGPYGRFKAVFTTRAELPSLFMVLRKTPHLAPGTRTDQMPREDLKSFYTGEWLYLRAGMAVPPRCSCPGTPHCRPAPAQVPVAFSSDAELAGVLAGPPLVPSGDEDHNGSEPRPDGATPAPAVVE